MNTLNLKLIRQLAVCFQSFEQMDSKRIRELNLTPSQFDIIATLGNTDGMCCKELGDKTLITKGTLTSVVDRLIAKNIVERIPSADDRRYQIIRLTNSGQALFADIFPKHVNRLDDTLATLSDDQKEETINILQRLTDVFYLGKQKDE